MWFGNSGKHLIGVSPVKGTFLVGSIQVNWCTPVRLQSKRQDFLQGWVKYVFVRTSPISVAEGEKSPGLEGGWIVRELRPGDGTPNRG